MQTPETRYNIYAVIHKALRAFMSHSLSRVGRSDWDDAEDRSSVLDEVEDLLQTCREHLDHEDRFVHPAMEARRPGSSLQTQCDHRGHEHHIDDLRRLARRLRESANGARQQAGEVLYRELASFVAENFEHMEVEERHNNAVLWSVYTDAEIVDIEQRLVATIAPERMSRLLRWMLPYASPAERLEMLGGMRQQAPREVFAGVMEMLRGLLLPREWNKLSAALGG